MPKLKTTDTKVWGGCYDSVLLMNTVKILQIEQANTGGAGRSFLFPIGSEYNMTRLEFRIPMHFARLYSFLKNFASLRENIKQYYYFRDLTIQ